ncbi:MAG: tetraacyldisaccharide 4'-kinase [Candidatus Omnitrophota bacterium]
MNDRLKKYFLSLMSDDPAVRGLVPGFLRWLLYGLSFVYGSLVAIARSGAKPYRPGGCKVISVGNITLGGTGKTPLVAAIARRFRQDGKKAVIITRGYMADAKTGLADEPEFYKRTLGGVPVITGRDRVASAKEAEAKYSPGLLLLDDGFQHWNLARDLDIVTVDVNNPFGNGSLLPRGILREPVSSLKRAGVVVITKVLPDMSSLGKAEALKNRIRQENPDAEVFNASYCARRLHDVFGGYETGLDAINGRQAALLCAIGDPRSFEETVVSTGAIAAARYYFTDHHIFTAAEIGRIIKECKGKGIDTIVTTEKDLPRIKNSGAAPASPEASGVRILALSVELVIDKEDKFFGRLDTLFTRKA